MALLKKKQTLWRGISYIVNSNWEVSTEDEAEVLLVHHKKLEVSPCNINYYGEPNFKSGTWVNINKEDDDIETFKTLFPYVPTACLVNGWNYVIEADDVFRTESSDDVYEYITGIMKTIP